MKERQIEMQTGRKIDCHVHIIGNGSSGSGCRLELRSLWNKIQARFLLASVGLSPRSLKEDFDRIYLCRLLGMLRESSLDAAVILAQDRPYDESGRKTEHLAVFYVPNDYVIDLARRHAELIPAASIHPGRPDALDELEKCIQGGVRILKLLPNCLNVDCADRRYLGFWRRMAEAGVMLLAHTGGEMSLPVINHAYAHPDRLRLPLDTGVKVIAAHAAGRSGFRDPDYTRQLIEMFERYPNLYADNSALCTLNRARTMRHILPDPIHRRVIYGSDYPIPVTGLSACGLKLIDREAYRRSRRQKNYFERDYQLKRAAGFPSETFTRLDHLLGNSVKV